MLASELQKKPKDWVTIAQKDTSQFLHCAFEAVAVLYPKNYAICYQSISISFEQLNHKANQLARYIYSLNLRPDCAQIFAGVEESIRVAIYLPQGTEITQSILAVLKLGYVFLPLSTDAEISDTRIIKALQKLKPQVILTSIKYKTKAAIDVAKQQGCHLLYLEQLADELLLLNPENLNREVDLNSIAYIYSTSGSTGEPKAVMVSQRNLVACMQSGIAALSVNANSRVAQLASIGFDASLMEIFMALLTGATLYLVPRDETGLLKFAQLENFYLEHRIDVSIVTPSLIGLMRPEKFPHLRLIYTGEHGNALGWNAKCGFGVTECTIGATIDGKAMQGVQIWILNEKQNKNEHEKVWVQAGENEIGEIFISGPCVGLGYWDDPVVTKSRFIEIKHPEKKEPFLFGYLTGDKGYKNNNNDLVVLGRADRQVKIHGKLIRPEEIQTTLSAFGNGNIFSGVYIDVLEYNNERPSLFLAFLIVRNKQEVINLQELQSYLSSQLTSSMVPSRWICFPNEIFASVSSNNKLDKEKLWAYWRENQNEYPLRFCQGSRKVICEEEIQNKIIEIWCEELHLAGSAKYTGDSMNLRTTARDEAYYSCKEDDSFFALGGTSIQCARLLQRLEVCKLQIDLTDFRGNPTLGYLFRQALRKETDIIPIVSCLQGNYPADRLLPPNIIPYFFLHSLLGKASADYSKLLEVCSKDKTIFGVDACGLTHPKLMGNTFREIAYQALEAIDKIYQGEIYILAGWSGGGLLALMLQEILEKKGKKVYVIMFDTIAAERLQNMKSDSFRKFLSSLIFGYSEKDDHSVRGRIPISDELLKLLFTSDFFNMPKQRVIYYLFNNLKQAVMAADKNANEKNVAIGLLTTIECILQAALSYYSPAQVRNVTLIAASESQKRYSSRRLGWPESWHLSIKSVEGDHFFMLDSQKLAQLNINSILELALAELKLQAFSQHLQSQYTSREHKIVKHVLGPSIPLLSCFIELVLVNHPQKNNFYRTVKQERDVCNTIIGSYEDIFALSESKIINPEDFFLRRKDSSQSNELRRTVLITGRAGSGKSILCKKLLNDIIQKKLWPEIKIVLLMQLKELNENKGISTLVGIIAYLFQDKRQAISLSAEEIVCNLHKLEENVLIIADGYDELDRNSKVYPVINDLIEKSSFRIILTSRPLAAPCSEMFDLHVSNIGFRKKHIDDFVKKYFREERREEAVKKFIHSNHSILELAHTPILLSLICATFDEIKENTVTTMTEIYTTIVKKILVNHLLNRPGEKEARKFKGRLNSIPADVLNNLYAKELITLQYYAFYGLENGHIILSEEFLNGDNIRLSIKSKIEESNPNEPAFVPLPEHIIELGIMQADEVNNRITNCAFLHLTLQEFFAAELWITFFFSKNVKEKEYAKKFLFQHKYDQKLEIFWWFVAGILAKKNTKQFVKFIQLLLTAPYDLLGTYAIPLLMRCLEEGSVNSDCYMIDLRVSIIRYLGSIFLYKNDFTLQEKMLRYLKQCPSFIADFKIKLSKELDDFSREKISKDYSHQQLFDKLCSLLSYPTKLYEPEKSNFNIPTQIPRQNLVTIDVTNFEAPMGFQTTAQAENTLKSENREASDTQELSTCFNLLKKEGTLKEMMRALAKIEEISCRTSAKKFNEILDLLFSLTSTTNNKIICSIWRLFSRQWEKMPIIYQEKIIDEVFNKFNQSLASEARYSFVTILVTNFKILSEERRKFIMQFCLQECRDFRRKEKFKNTIKVLSLFFILSKQEFLEQEEKKEISLFFLNANKTGLINEKYIHNQEVMISIANLMNENLRPCPETLRILLTSSNKNLKQLGCDNLIKAYQATQEIEATLALDNCVLLILKDNDKTLLKRVITKIPKQESAASDNDLVSLLISWLVNQRDVSRIVALLTLLIPWVKQPCSEFSMLLKAYANNDLVIEHILTTNLSEISFDMGILHVELMINQLDSFKEERLVGVLSWLGKNPQYIRNYDGFIIKLQDNLDHNNAKIRQKSAKLILQLCKVTKEVYDAINLNIIFTYSQHHDVNALELACAVFNDYPVKLPHSYLEYLFSLILASHNAGSEEVRYLSACLLDKIENLDNFIAALDIPNSFEEKADSVKELHKKFSATAEKVVLEYKSGQQKYKEKVLGFLKKLVTFRIKIALSLEPLFLIELQAQTMEKSSVYYNGFRVNLLGIWLSIVLNETNEELFTIKLNEVFTWYHAKEEFRFTIEHYIAELFDELSLKHKYLILNGFTILIRSCTDAKFLKSSIVKYILKLDKKWAKEHAIELLDYLIPGLTNRDAFPGYLKDLFPLANADQKSAIEQAYLRRLLEYGCDWKQELKFFTETLDLLSNHATLALLQNLIIICQKNLRYRWDDAVKNIALLISKIFLKLKSAVYPQLEKCIKDINATLSSWKIFPDSSNAIADSFHIVGFVENLAVGIPLSHLPDAVILLNSALQASFWKTNYSIARLLSTIDMSDYLDMDWGGEKSNEHLLMLFSATPLRSIIKFFCQNPIDPKRNVRLLEVITNKLAACTGIILTANDDLYIQSSLGIECLNFKGTNIAKTFVNKLEKIFSVCHHCDLSEWRSLAAKTPFVLDWHNTRSLIKAPIKFSLSFETIKPPFLIEDIKETALTGQLSSGEIVRFLIDNVRESPQNNYFFLNQISRNEAVFILEQGTIDAVFCKNIALDMVSALIEKIFTFAPSDEHIELHSLYKNYLYSREQDTYRRLLSELSNPNIITMYLNEVIGKNGPAGRFSVEYLAKIKNISLYIWYRENENTSVISLCYACGVEDMRSCPHLLYTGDKGQYRLISCPPLNLLNRDSISPLDKQGINH